MDTNLKKTTKTSEQDASTIVATDTKTDTKEKMTAEELKISGDVLVTKIKELIAQGNVRRIIIKTEEDHTLIEIPMTVGVIGSVISAVLFPVIAAVGVIGAMVAHLTVVIERQESD
ncbi:MAG: DUF4342 domain-containing protein [Pleurocapsa sp. SU_5_0]|nr:DUF4342 domain-containing protein [Pleurocapsa sp. SU_5_0]NJO97599.1 DUF4342 domain-containing protein [Pleurocapsa sp. CRU_1_2]NJR46778.1 DUF4342 domain-containing protein [Hyellaceae cyanobacterium CSU_1_1]